MTLLSFIAVCIFAPTAAAVLALVSIIIDIAVNGLPPFK